MNLFLAAQMKPAADFFAVYEPSNAADLDSHHRGLLLAALSNGDLSSRYKIANELLDDGAPLGSPGPNGATVLHVLFGQVAHDIEQDTNLAERLIEKGADINALDDAQRVPFLEVLNMRFTDEQLEPIYDLWFEQPNPDFTTVSKHGVSPLDFAERLPYRSEILARMERHVATRA